MAFGCHCVAATGRGPSRLDLCHILPAPTESDTDGPPWLPRVFASRRRCHAQFEYFERCPKSLGRRIRPVQHRMARVVIEPVEGESAVVPTEGRTMARE
jgi:hypothetical protein